MKFNILFSNATLKTCLIISFSLIALISTTLLGVVSYKTSYNGIINECKNYDQKLVKQLCSNIDLYFGEILKVTESLSSNSNIKYYGNYFPSIGMQDNLESIRLLLYEAALQRQDIDDISIFYNKQRLVSCYNTYSIDEMQKMVYYYDIREIYLMPKVLPFTYRNESGRVVFTAVKSVYTPEERDSFESFVIVNFTMNTIDELFSKNKFNTDSFAYIIDRSGNIHYSTNKEDNTSEKLQPIISRVGTSQSFTVNEKIENKEYLITINPLKHSELFVLSATPLESLTQFPKKIGAITFSMVCFCIILAISISFLLSSFFTKPLTKLVNHMSRVSEGNFSKVDSVGGSFEVQALYSKFNDMIEKINMLIKESEEKNRLKRKAELDALQAQINPHFLYNTLHSINSMAILLKAKDIMKMTTSLSKLLRLSINKGNELTTIADELEHVKCYFNIQKIRYKDKFSMIVDVEEEIMSYNIVKLVLQPLVENAIYHGLELKEGHGTILIRGFSLQDKIQIDIVDDGVGIELLRLDSINQSLKEAKEYDRTRSIGLYNVNERLKLQYGENYGLKISSIKNQGTTVTIIIPKSKGEDRNDKSLNCG